MTDAAEGPSAQERRALWLEVVTWPLKGGMLGGVVLLTALSYALSRWEGGATQAARETGAMVQGAFWIVGLAVLGHYAWRALSCTFPEERRVPWGGDEREAKSVGERVSTFVGVFVISFLPLFVWLGLRHPIGAPGWVDALLVPVCAVIGASMFPLGLAGAVARGSLLGALPGPVLLMWKAEPRAARIAWTTALVFVGLLLLSMWLATWTTAKTPAEGSMPGEGKETMSESVRWTLFALRAAGFYAGLVSFRVAGLLVREVPEIRKVIG